MTDPELPSTPDVHTEADDETSSEKATAANARSMPGPWKLATVVTALLLVVSLVGLVVLWWDRSELQDRVDAEAAATDEAERIVVAWLSYDHRTYVQDMEWVTESGTERFREDYSPESLDELRKRMVGPRKLISTGRVVRSAATAQDPRHVTVLIFTDQTLTDEQMRRQGEQPLHARSGVELQMVSEDGQWLVDELNQLQFD